MNKKAEQFLKNLKELNLENLQAQEIDDELHTVIFRSNLDINGTLLPFAVFIDDSIYTVFRVQIAAKVVMEKKKKHIMDYMNESNMKYKIFKYYVNADGELLLDCCIPFASEDAFNPTLIRVIMDVAGQHLIDEYANILKMF